MTRLLPILLFALGCATTPAARTDLLVRRYEMYGFTGSVLVAKGGRVVLDRNYGLSERAFDVGSIMKTVVAAAVLELERDGKLRVSDPISKYIDALPADRGAITIHQLLLHTSGLPLDVQNGDLLATVRTAPIGAAQYSNVGYGLLALIAEQVAQKPFAEFARARLLQPAGLRETSFWGEPSLPMVPAYSGNSDDELTPAAPHVRNDPASPMWGKYVFGAGGLVTTTRDLFRWWQFLDARPGTFTEQAEGQAYGWNVRRQPDGSLRHYRGGLIRNSYMSMLSAYRGHDVVLIWMMNKNTGWHEPLTKNFERILADQPHVVPPAVVPGRDDIADEYASDTARIAITRDGNDLLLAAEGQEALSLVWFLDDPARAATMNREIAAKNPAYEILGTGAHPSAKGNLQTFVRHEGEILRFISDGQNVLATGRGYPKSAQRRFRRTGKGAYALYDPKRDAVAALRIDKSEAVLTLADKTVRLLSRPASPASPGHAGAGSTHPR